MDYKTVFLLRHEHDQTEQQIKLLKRELDQAKSKKRELREQLYLVDKAFRDGYRQFKKGFQEAKQKKPKQC